MKKQQLYLSSIAEDAQQTAKDYGLGLELAQFCTAAFLDSPEKVGELFPQDCARYLSSSLAACLSSSDRFVLHGPFNELCPAAIDPLVLEITEKRYRQAIDRAVSLFPYTTLFRSCSSDLRSRCVWKTSWSRTRRCCWKFCGR